MAKAYAVSILSTTPGPVLLGGWSFGGVVAYEIALQLTAQGIQVKGIILIDSPSPINHTPLTPPLINHILTLENPNIHNAKSAALIQKQFSSSSEMLSRYVPHATASLCPPLVLLRSVEGFSPSNGDKIQVPKWLEDRTDLQTSVAGWESLAHCTVKVLDIPGHHFSAFHPSNVSIL
ncbi:hypothetical protein MIND_00677200 [Mycena indigotica]|uniref:Thioesterase domain-containing protein n=1 Tax=Mycena indigotica TaxID=2126181 RepID=A0A8H6SKP9_9AGAR|nr:uncharacterized protein MIND_00677200 [Mycena indigotica]KAF7301129.1 hypothetical protein MIND_00677200 [Mycena indigotica]